jgi:hypothetical protein
MTNTNDPEIGLYHADTGEVLMLDKKERILVKEILGRVLSSEAGQEAIEKKFGKEYVEIAHRLLEALTGITI